MNQLSKESHKVEEIDGIRCSIVEKDVAPDRVEFLRRLLTLNGFEVKVTQTPAPPPKKVPPPKPAAEGEPAPPPPPPPPAPEAPNTFIVGVTNISFHAMLAVYERSLRTPEGDPVSVAYWNQEPVIPGQKYWERRKN